ncbi:MAG: FUSC family protein, partial [Gammaproteobacteria bacterium]
MRYLTAITTTIRNFDFYSERAVNSFKTAFACLLGLAIIQYFKIPSGQWIVITIIVIMSTQTRLGGALQRSYARTIGTLCGAAVGMLTVTLFEGSFLASSIVIFISVLIFSYIATSPGYISSAGTIGGTTLALLLINQEPGVSYPIERMVEIMGGIALALLVSVSVFPIHARKILLYNFASSCKKIASFYQESLCSPAAEKTEELNENQISEDDIIKQFTA